MFALGPEPCPFGPYERGPYKKRQPKATAAAAAANSN
jgi:hypothetical protein